MRLIEAEAKRRCLAGGFSLDMPARNLTSYPVEAADPLWSAYYVPSVEAEIDKLDQAGFDVRPKGDVLDPKERLIVASVLAMALGPLFVVAFAVWICGGWR